LPVSQPPDRIANLRNQGHAFCDLTEVFELIGRENEAARALRQALDRYERKEVIPLAEHVHERLAALEPA
jgi:hypothetical protein